MWSQILVRSHRTYGGVAVATVTARVEEATAVVAKEAAVRAAVVKEVAA